MVLSKRIHSLQITASFVIVLYATALWQLSAFQSEMIAIDCPLLNTSSSAIPVYCYHHGNEDPGELLASKGTI